MIIKIIDSIKQAIEGLPEKGMVWLSDHRPDKEGRKALFVLVAAILLIVLIAKEIQVSKTEEKELLVITEYVQSTLESPKSDKVFEVKKKEIKLTALPRLESNGYQYNLEGIRRFENCEKIVSSIREGVRKHLSQAIIRLDHGVLYPAIVTKDWNETDLKNFSTMACEIVHQNKTAIMFDINYPSGN